MPTSLIAPIVSGVAATGASKLFGGGSTSGPISSFSPAGINAGGLTSTFTNGNINISPSADRSAAIANIGNTFGDQADFLGGLAARVAPGISDLRAARLQEIENARTSAIGNLKDNLARRRVLGSSFGQDAVSRSEAEFGKAKAQASAESFLQELDLTNQFMTQRFAADRAQFQTGLDEMNLEANLAASLAGKATDQLGANARILSQLNAAESINAGKLFGQSFGPAFTAIGDRVGGLFGSGGSGGGGGGGGGVG